MKKIAFLVIAIVLISSFQAKAIDTKEAEIFFDNPDKWGTEIHISYNPGYREIIARHGDRGISSLRRINFINGKAFDYNQLQLVIFAEKEVHLTKKDLESLIGKKTDCQFIKWANENDLRTIIIYN